jgi:hypothetical protein
MPSLGSRSLAKDEKALRRTTISPYAQHDEHDRSRHASSPGLSAPQHDPFKRAASVDVARLEAGSRGRRMSAFMAPTPPSPPDDSRTQTPRFTLLRFRNASEPQLSAKAREHASQSVPPVPAVPASKFALWMVLFVMSITRRKLSPRHHHHSSHRRARRTCTSSVKATAIQVSSLHTTKAEPKGRARA